ncbi:outer membrane protein assembly factor BamD [Bryocella elongata]|uniref:Outer membrane protein assembly factor BamD n=1 Tax=Bryocella elongata TaxID=863522 RepID=A0A1H6AJ49_9BACT|nr:outer membrane protein assembly factor BamD [Bryocella elongata]SEG48541.1 outer membrane protein assembly factor BamD [Bryocella elongata]
MRFTMSSFFPSRKAAQLAGLALAVALVSLPLKAQDAAAPASTSQQTSGTPASGTSSSTAAKDDQPAPKKHKPIFARVRTPDEQAKVDQDKAEQAKAAKAKAAEAKANAPKVDKKDRVTQTKDTRREIKKESRDKILVGKDASLPDKQLYDKALAQEKSGHFDVARLDLQTLLNTYPDSQYLMRAKLAVADCWYKEGGTASLTQAEQEYNDFITFFPNVPEAAEAQMRIGDIYFKQMDVPDRDYAKANKAEAAYRTMLKQYPDSPKEVRDEATQKLREVQEILATRESEIAAFYASHENWAATIARYDTVIDSYPLYSHLDDALIGKGDAYAAQARAVRNTPTCVPNVKPVGPCLSEDIKARLLQYDDGLSADAYRKVVLEHAAAPHVEDAKERLASMGLPIPTPTAEQVAASDALEGSRAQYNIRRRLELLMMHRPDTVTAAQIGAPPLDDPPATTAPSILKEIREAYTAALNPNAPKPGAAPNAPVSDAAGDTPAAPAAPVSTAAPSLLDVPGPGGSTTDSTVAPMTPATEGGASGTGVGVEVLSPNGGSSAPVTAKPAFAPASDLPSATGKADPNFGLKTAAPTNTSALPDVEKPADAPDQINEAAGKPQAAQAADQSTDAKGKKKKTKSPKEDKADESSSKDKKKKGLDKLNPF